MKTGKETSALRNVAKQSLRVLEEAHDTHIFAPNDAHDTKNCRYCAFRRQLRTVLARTKP